jgi:L-malate glycosyltransferase
MVHTTLGNFVQRHAEAVNGRHQVYVLYPARMSNTEAEGGAILWDGRFAIFLTESLGVREVRVYYRHRIHAAAALEAGWQALQSKWPVQMDIIHHHVLWPSVWQAWMMKRKLRIPLVATEHWTGFLTGRAVQLKWWQKIYLRVASRAIDCMAPVTHNLAEAMQKVGIGGRYEVVPNVVDVALFQDAPKSARPVRFLHISSLHDDQKNIRGLLRVWKKFSDEQSDALLSIGGDGPWEMWQEEARRMNIRDAGIHFFGTLAWDEVALKMGTSHVLVLFSRYENLPCVIVEAMASGMRVISTAVGGIAEYVSPERGTLLASEDEDALLEALRYEWQAEPDREQLRVYAVEHFSQQAVADAFHAIYASLWDKVQK